MKLGYLIIALWASWAAYWYATARNIKPTEIPPDRSPLYFLVPLAICDTLLITPCSSITVMSFPILGTILVAMGLAYACWARYELGSNWNGYITIQKGHSLVTTGPYRYMRHPIYCGLTVAFVSTGLFLGQLHTYIAPLFAIGAFIYKARIEEAQLLEAFPIEYAAYKKATII